MVSVMDPTEFRDCCMAGLVECIAGLLYTWYVGALLYWGAITCSPTGKKKSKKSNILENNF
jgi:hypothetical protein